jgi:hypothetical protein
LLEARACSRTHHSLVSMMEHSSQRTARVGDAPLAFKKSIA